MANVRLKSISPTNIMNPGKPNQTHTYTKRSRSFSMQTEFCPLCSKNGAKVRVKAYQLNLEEAVFMCSTDECTWPVGYHELLFMDRPMGRYATKDWPEIADQFLANHLKKQRDSLSELSAYTPPQTPGHSKDAVHDTSTAGPSSLPAVKEDYVLEQQPSTSKNKKSEVLVIDLVNEDEPSFVSSGPLVVPKSERILVIAKEGNGSKIVTKSKGFVANPFIKQRTSVVDKPVVIVDEKPSVCMPEKSIASENLICKKFRLIGKKKAKSFTYKKQFDIFDDIKKAKSTNEQCKAQVAIKSKIDLDKMKPNEIKEVLFVNNKSTANDLINVKTESTVGRGIKIEVQERLIKVEKKVCQANVNNTVEVVKKDPVADSLIQILDGDSSNSTVEGKEVSLDTLSKETSTDHPVHYDFDTIMKDSPAGFESGESWSGTDHNLESLLALLEDESSENSLLVLNDDASPSKATLQKKKPANNLIAVDGPLNALTLNDNPSTSNLILLSKESTDNLMTVDDTINDSVLKTNDASLGNNLMTIDDPMNANASSSNATLPDQSIKNKDNFVAKVDKEAEVEPTKQDMDIDSIIDDDTLQCTIEDTDDPFFASLFSPPLQRVE